MSFVTSLVLYRLDHAHLLSSVVALLLMLVRVDELYVALSNGWRAVRVETDREMESFNLASNLKADI